MQMFSHLGSQLVDLCSALLLLTCFAIVAQRRLSACVGLFALQSAFLVLTTALVAFLTGNHHIYIAAGLTGLIKVVIIPRVLKKVIERLNVKRELVMNVNVPVGLLICGESSEMSGVVQVAERRTSKISRASLYNNLSDDQIR